MCCSFYFSCISLYNNSLPFTNILKQIWKMSENTQSHEKYRAKSVDSFNLSSSTKLPVSEEAGKEPYEPWRNRNIAHPLGTLGALFHLVKGALGSGILAMPVGFKNGGLWVSLGCALLVGIIYTHCVHILVYSCQICCARLKRPQLAFAEIAEAAFQTGPAKWRKHTLLARDIVDIGLFMGYYSCCVVYVVFTASSLKQVIENDLKMDLNIRIYVLLVTFAVVPIGLIRNLKFLVPFSFTAICALTFGCGFVFYEVFQDLPPVSTRPAFTSFSRLPLFFATVIYAVDGIGTVLPIENNMKNPQHFLGKFGVLNLSMIWLMALYCSMGFFGYLHYGEDTKGSITLNISSSIMGQIVKMMVSLNVLCSFGLFLYVPCEIMWRRLESRLKGGSKTMSYYTMRLVLILGAVLLGAVVPDLEPFVGLVGAICSSTLVLFFPPIIETVTFWEDDEYMGHFRWRVYKNLLLLIMWIITLISGTRISLEKIIQLYS